MTSNSADLNVCEHVGVIRKDGVEGLMLQKPINCRRFSRCILEENVNKMIQNLSNDTEVFESPLRTYPR
ncbi:hypothetical protein Pmani_034217 [Petrolisthes manimaculis]|uniref:Uncharacterized protein n=1 Tax=Petrolisthes manimaculis TaxID=1843537 RepID=A0AAE1NMY5_9EUCA|nr:hypothetical protein Pmani_034217 [Petrolisthes manimaculis]